MTLFHARKPGRIPSQAQASERGEGTHVETHFRQRLIAIAFGGIIAIIEAYVPAPKSVHAAAANAPLLSARAALEELDHARGVLLSAWILRPADHRLGMESNVYRSL